MTLYALLYICEASDSHIFGFLIEEIVLPTDTSLVLTSKVRRGQDHLIAAKRLREQGAFGLEKVRWTFYCCLQLPGG